MSTLDTPARRSARTILRATLAAAVLGAALAACGHSPTAVRAPGGVHGDNNGIMGSGYDVPPPPPDTTHP